MERPLATKAGIDWIGKHSLILNREAGSWFFLGELLIDLPLPVDAPHLSNAVAALPVSLPVPTALSSSPIPLTRAAASPI